MRIKRQVFFPRDFFCAFNEAGCTPTKPKKSTKYFPLISLGYRSMTNRSSILIPEKNGVPAAAPVKLGELVARINELADVGVRVVQSQRLFHTKCELM